MKFKINKQKKSKKILIFKIGALGDILMSTPFLRELRKSNKNSKIDFLVGDNSKIILKNNIYLNKIITFDHNIFFNKNIIKFYKLVRRIKKENYDEIYILDKHWIFHLFSFLTRIPKRVGFIRSDFSKFLLTDFVNYFNIKHEVDYYLSLINKENIKNKKLYYNLGKKYINKVKLKLKKLNINDFIIVINDGGINGVEKGGIRMLPDDKFKELIEKVSENNKVLLLGGHNLKSYYNNFLLNKNVLNIAGCSIDESFAYLKLAKDIYTTDCGPMHMAACVNDNITCFFGPTNPKRKSPFVKNLKVIWDDKDIYEEDYELYGKLPNKNKKFFKRLNFDFIKWKLLSYLHSWVKN